MTIDKEQGEGPAAPVGDRFDRAAFLTEVGINSRTLTRWISEGVIVPVAPHGHTRGRQAFTREQARFARGLAALLQRYKGRLRLEDAVAIVHNEVLPPDEWHNPNDRLTERPR